MPAVTAYRHLGAEQSLEPGVCERQPFARDRASERCLIAKKATVCPNDNNKGTTAAAVVSVGASWPRS